MRVLMMVKSFYPVIGGVETAVYEVARGLSKDYDITILTVSEDKKFRLENYDGFKVVKTPRFAKVLSTPISFSYPFWVRKLSLEADLIHFHSPHPLGELSLHLFPSNTRLLVTYHFDIVKQKNLKWIYYPSLKKILQKAKKITVSNPNIITSSDLLSVFKDNCIEIPYGIRLEEYNLKPSIVGRALKLKEKYSKPLILFVGRLVYYKGVQYLIEAMQNIDAYLLIIGEGPLKNKLIKIVNKLNLTNRVEIKNHLSREELLIYFYICNLFVLPSIVRTEAFGMVLLEAMVYGKPLVTTELGTGTSFININGKTGFVVPPTSPDALSVAINNIINDKNLQNEMGENALIRVKSEFNAEKYISRYRELYQNILSS
jgi:rhamnosyl/mannosyltransferase